MRGICSRPFLLSYVFIKMVVFGDPFGIRLVVALQKNDILKMFGDPTELSPACLMASHGS